MRRDRLKRLERAAPRHAEGEATLNVKALKTETLRALVDIANEPEPRRSQLAAEILRKDDEDISQ